MPNERNVAALVEVIASTGLAPQHDSWVRVMAAALASRGVLVPQAMTDQEIDQMLQRGVHLYGDQDDGYAYDFEAEPLKQTLERIAKGEEP